MCVCVCVSVCVCVLWKWDVLGWTGQVKCDLCCYCTSYYVCVITSGHSQGAAAEADTVGEEQAELCAIREQELKWMKLGAAAEMDEIWERTELEYIAAEAGAIMEQQLKQVKLLVYT